MVDSVPVTPFPTDSELSEDAILAWLAALVDGEGSVMLNTHQSHNHRGRGYSLRPVLIISNNDKRLMDALVTRTGISRVYTHKRSVHESPRKRDTYTWRMGATDLREWGPKLLPHLVLKHEQLSLLLEFLSLQVPGPRANPDWDRCLEIQREIRALNARGKESV